MTDEAMHDFLLTVFSDVVTPFQKLSYLLLNTVSHQLATFPYHLSNQIHY
jgi:hypothetical protein